MGRRSVSRRRRAKERRRGTAMSSDGLLGACPLGARVSRGHAIERIGGATQAKERSPTQANILFARKRLISTHIFYPDLAGVIHTHILLRRRVWVHVAVIRAVLPLSSPMTQPIPSWCSALFAMLGIRYQK